MKILKIMKNQSFILLVLLFGFMLIGCEAKKEKDTWGLSDEELSLVLTGVIVNTNYNDLLDGTVLDKQAGLIWSKCSQGQVYRKTENDCRGKVSGSLYTPNDQILWGASTYAYCNTNTWACNSKSIPLNLVENAEFILPGYSEAFNSCNSLNSSNGFPGWRVPTNLELVKLTIGGRIALMQYFPDTVENLYWSSWSKQDDQTGEKAIAVNFDRQKFGEEQNIDKVAKTYLRCIRPSVPVSR
jgi:hypothetical protein